jgi:hypothetical protein
LTNSKVRKEVNALYGWYKIHLFECEMAVLRGQGLPVVYYLLFFLNQSQEKDVKRIVSNFD